MQERAAGNPRRGSLKRWLDKSFDFSEGLSSPVDGRERPQIPLSRALGAVFWGSVFRLESAHSMEHSCCSGPLRSRVGPLSEDTIGNALEEMDLESLQRFWSGILKKAKTKQMLRSDIGGGLLFVCLDGIEIFSSYSRCCDYCLQREVSFKKEDGAETTYTQYYHRLVVACLIGCSFPAPVGVEPVLPGEDEVAAGTRLLKKLRRRLGKRFFDVVVADALYATERFFKFVTGQGWDIVVCLKENQPGLLAEAGRLTHDREADYLHEEGERYSRRLWDEFEVYWDAAGASVRVVRSVENKRSNRIEGGKKTAVFETSENYWLTTLKSVSATSLFTVGKLRWEIDSNLFADLTSYWGFKHMAVHKPTAYLAVSALRLMAYLLFHLWVIRQVMSRTTRKLPPLKEIAQSLYQDLPKPSKRGLSKKAGPPI
ncbi:MAG: transposase [bacterium]